MSADNVHHHFISNDDIIDDNRDTLINHLPQATEPKTTTTTTATVNRPTGSGHCRHNSLVDFSFIMDQSSTNTLTLTHLNSLFEKIADRHSRGINSVKLYKLILKTDINKHKIDWYRCKLGIDCSVDATECVANENADESPSHQRIVARGPFIAMFKHEKIAFVNSLDAASRSLCSSHSKKKRKSKSKRRKSHGNSNNSISSSGSHSTLSNDWTIKNSVKTEPVQRTTDRQDTINMSDNGKGNGQCEHPESKSQSRSPKRKKIEDKMGMIIVAEIDHDEISAVSVSPTSENSDCGGGNNLRNTIVADKNLMARERSRVRNSGSLRTRKDRKSSSRNSSRKERRSGRKMKSGGGRSDSLLRSIRSIGDDTSQGGEDVCDDDSTSSCTTATSSSISLSTRNRRRTKSMMSLDQDDDTNSICAESIGEKHHKHERNPSNEEPTVDIREVMDDSSNHFGTYHNTAKHPYGQNYHYGNMNMYPHMYQIPSGCALGDRNPTKNGHDLIPGMNQTLSYQDLAMVHQGHHHQVVYPNNYMNHPLQHNPYHPVNHTYHYNMHWQPQPYYDSSSSGDTGSSGSSREGNVVYEECSFLKGLATIVKKIFRIEKNTEMLDHSSPTNGEDNHHQASRLSASGNNWSSHHCNDCTKISSEQVQHQPPMTLSAPTPFQTHDRAEVVPNINRPRSRSRVYSGDEDLMRDCNNKNANYPHKYVSVSSLDQTTFYNSEFSSVQSASIDLSPTTLSCSTSSYATSCKTQDNLKSNGMNNSPQKAQYDKIERVLSFQLKKDEDGQIPKYKRPRLYSCPDKTTGKGIQQKMKPLPSLISNSNKRKSENCDDKPILEKSSSSSGNDNTRSTNKKSCSSRSGRSSSKGKKLKERSINNCQSQSNRGSDGRKGKKVNLLSSSSKPSSIVGSSRSKTDGIRMLRGSSMAKPSLSRMPLSRSSSLGSSTSSRNIGEGDRRSHNTLLSLR